MKFKLAFAHKVGTSSLYKQSIESKNFFYETGSVKVNLWFGKKHSFCHFENQASNQRTSLTEVAQFDIISENFE